MCVCGCQFWLNIKSFNFIFIFFNWHRDVMLLFIIRISNQFSKSQTFFHSSILKTTIRSPKLFQKTFKNKTKNHPDVISYLNNINFSNFRISKNIYFPIIFFGILVFFIIFIEIKNSWHPDDLICSKIGPIFSEKF